MIEFDPTDGHLHLFARTHPAVMAAAAGVVIGGFPHDVPLWLAYGGLSRSHAFDVAMVRAAARLATEGPAAYLEELRFAGLADSSGAEPERNAQAVVATGYPATVPTLASVLAHPLSGAAHAVLAESLLAHGAIPLAGVEARVALGLDGAPCDDFLVGHVLALRGMLWNAAVELRRALAASANERCALRARAELVQVESAQKEMQSAARGAQQGAAPAR